MIELHVTADDPLDVEVDVLLIPVFKGGIEGPGVQRVLATAGLDELPRTPDFRGDIGQTLLLSARGTRARALCLVGLGRMNATDGERLRQAAAIGVAAASHATTLATTLSQVHARPGVTQAVAEGLLLGSYQDRRFTTRGDPSKVRAATLLIASSQLEPARQALMRARHYAVATCAARDLVNLPPDRKRPGELAERIRELNADACDVEIVDEHTLADGGYGGILGVGRGSAAPPRLVRLHYRPEQPLGHVVLVGKGITFDSGGLSLKRGSHMDEMKSDMAGAAAIAGACSVLAGLGVRLEVTALLPLAENMPGADAGRPDDVLRMRDGQTVEVLDTDAEGRLVLADALADGANLKPDAMVDLATLTGSAIGALGQYAGALMANDTELADALLSAADVAGEVLWRLPLWDELDTFLDSPIADVANVTDSPGGGAITAGLFLRRFTGETPWAHLDIAGPAFLSQELARDHRTVGGTGYGVRTLLAWLEQRGA